MQFTTLIAAAAVGFSSAVVAVPTNHNPSTHYTPSRPTGKCSRNGGNGHGICQIYDSNPSLSTSRIVQRPLCSPEKAVSQAAPHAASSTTLANRLCYQCRTEGAHCDWTGGYAWCSLEGYISVVSARYGPRGLLLDI